MAEALVVSEKEGDTERAGLRRWAESRRERMNERVGAIVVEPSRGVISTCA
jgi:hypothetical protein